MSQTTFNAPEATLDPLQSECPDKFHNVNVISPSTIKSDHGSNIVLVNVPKEQFSNQKTSAKLISTRAIYQSLQSQHPSFVLQLRKFFAEFLGTFLLVSIGIGSVASAVLTGSLKGLWQVAVVWGCGVTVSIYTVGHISGAHLNPAVSLVMAVFGHYTGFKWSSLVLYITAQLAGSIVAGAVQLALWSPFITLFEQRNGIVRSADPGCMRSGMIFGSYFPNPDMFPLNAADASKGIVSSGLGLVSVPRALMTEALGTCILLLVIFALTDRRNKNKSIHEALVPPTIGATVAVLISMLSPITQAAFNPARDLGPRIIASLAGWELCAFGPSGSFWIYIVGPCLGALLGGVTYFGLLYQSDEEIAYATEQNTPLAE
ncbi:hypothetical protein BASA50_004241 [Batrachochytrium salamandrivorans]|uniref:Aquaporin n=1 Tax=Batrachochytrium salamandrivorans TaxID=1357716 RepID=A0ABQ8FIW4_9FUNG|nr:hypothetical protein BASA62_007441 [Batrachochytrium salamandrivorans]KAH6579185.1 hypothetical protein BASA60_003369 [Batrachochytrium salamandrivorans]KAH6597634.1 hypothetical protein BASA50_004241 [Batrachochytrium salamandrivorans]KAH6602161.1 hypothetical protein BASA61_001407 [Batrachochytrium salamandrivorans]KAH9254694.1 hypothetical protein BASA81_007244 [Batrachochytrium salamandrivorans]